jgi:DNA-3-methyladenine glycosylase I
MTDGLTRCGWIKPPDDALYLDYHDTEWGVPEYDDRALFEKLVLDGFQAGLSWLTILRKRVHFRAAFDGFDPVKIARYGEADVARLLADPGIVRHRGKIEGAVRNARAWLEVMESEPEGFSGFIWSYVDGRPVHNRWRRLDQVPAATPMSEALSKDLKARGFVFVGPTIVYAFAQAVGMVNDHLIACHRHAPVAAMGR